MQVVFERIWESRYIGTVDSRWTMNFRFDVARVSVEVNVVLLFTLVWV